MVAAAAGGGVERMVRLAKSMMIALWSYHLNNIIFTLAVFLPSAYSFFACEWKGEFAVHK